MRFILRHQHFQRTHHKIGQRIDVLAALPHITPVGLEDTQIAARRIDIFRAGNGPRQRFFAIGRAVRMVNIVPFLPEQLGLPKQPVHLFPVPARPEGQSAAQSQIGLGLAAEFLLPTAFPQCGKVLAVLGRGGLLQHLLVRQGNRANGPLGLAFRRLFLGDVGFVNPGQRLRTIRNALGRTLQPVAGHGEIPRRGVHFHGGLAVLIALAGHGTAIENV